MSESTSKPKKTLTFSAVSEQRKYYKGKEAVQGEGEGEGEVGEIYQPEIVDTKTIRKISENPPKEVIRLSSAHFSKKRSFLAPLLDKPLLVLTEDHQTRYLKLLKIKRQLKKQYTYAKAENNKELKNLIKKDLKNIESSIEEIEHKYPGTNARGFRKTRKLYHKKQTKRIIKSNPHKQTYSRKSKKHNKKSHHKKSRKH